MKKYPKYKDSGAKWIGSIPEGWDAKRIKHITYVKGRIGWQGMRSDEFLEISDSYIVTGTDFGNGRIQWETCHQVPIDRYNEDPFIQLKNEDLLITKDGTIGKVALVRNLPKIATLNSGVFLTRPKNGSYDNAFMYWVLVSDVFKIFYDYNKSGSTIQHLYQNVFDEFKFPIPPLSEQQQIVTYLDHKTSLIDQIISNSEKKIELLKEQRTTTINHAVTKGLNPKVKMKDSGVEWIGEIPEGWKRKKIKTVSEVISKGTTPSTVGKDILDEGEIRYLKSENIVDNRVLDLPRFFIDSETNNILKRSILLEGDLLFVIAGASLGKVAILPKELSPSNTNQAVSFIRLKNEENRKYIWYWLTSSKIQEQLWLDAVQSAQPNLSMENLGNFFITYPPLQEQQQIVTHLDQKTKEIDDLISSEQKRIELLKEYRQSLISEVVTGKIKVN